MTSEHDRITQKYLRRYPNSKRTKSWAGRMVHIQTENGVWRINGKGYTYAHKQDAWVLSFEDAQKQVNHCGPEKQAAFIDATTRAVPDVPELVTVTEDLLRGVCKSKGWIGREHGSIPNIKTGGWIHPFSITINSRDIADLFVLKDQAAAVIAAKDSELALKDTGLKIAVSKIAALEAKLTQIEKPVGYVSKSFFESLKIDRFHSIAAYVLRESSERYSEPLYTAPVASDADLRAENLLKRSQRFVALVHKCCRKNNEYSPLHWQEMVELDRDLSALNPSEPRT